MAIKGSKKNYAPAKVVQVALLGKPVKVLSFKGTAGWSCVGCVAVMRTAIMFDVKGQLFCTRKCAHSFLDIPTV